MFRSRLRLSLMPSVCGILIASAVILRVYNHQVYDLTSSHDGPTHRHFVMQAHAWMMPDYYCGPFYYYWVAWHSSAVDAVGLLPSSYEDPQLNFTALGTVLGNFHLFLWYLAGVYAFGRALSLSRVERLQWTALSAALPIVHRSMNMLRPENLMLAALPWVLLLIVEWWQRTRNGAVPFRESRPWPAILLAAVFSTQKLGGAAVVTATVAGLLPLARSWRSKSLRTAVLACVMFACVVGAITLIHHETTAHKRWLFRHFAYKNPVFAMYHNAAPWTFFVNIDPVAVWRDPFRDAHRGSMPNILLADFFGDYWRYGIDYRILNPEPPFRSARIRLGLIATAVFVVCWLIGIARVLRDWGHGGEAAWARGVTAILVPAVSIFFVASAARVFYQPAKGDIIKWEYMIWIAPALALGVLGGTFWEGRTGRLCSMALILLTTAGLLQSVQPG